jgi:hypothetical protein
MRVKKRNELPGWKKLALSFDIERLRADFDILQAKSAWDGLNSEYRALCEEFEQLPPFFMEENHQGHGVSLAYQQLALTEFDENFSLSQRTERSGTFWDKTSPHRKTRADERFYRKWVPGLPAYLQEVLGTFQPFLHRARFAKLAAGHSVKPHIDYDTSYSVRLHIPLITNESCKIGVQYQDESKEEVHFPADGSVYFVNQGLLHWATNPSTEARVHLILSVDSQRFLQDAQSSL